MFSFVQYVHTCQYIYILYGTASIQLNSSATLSRKCYTNSQLLNHLEPSVKTIQASFIRVCRYLAISTSGLSKKPQNNAPLNIATHAVCSLPFYSTGIGDRRPTQLYVCYVLDTYWLYRAVI